MPPTSRWCWVRTCSPTTGRSTTFRRSAPRCPGPWRSTGDTEVLLHLLAQRGRACLEQVVGMFAFASWDADARRLLLARDRLGIKPLYYRMLPDGIAFASELKALLVLGKPEIDQSAVRDYLFHGYVPAPKTIYRGICKLPAGHTLTWESGRVQIERYWTPSTAIAAAQRRGHARTRWTNCCARSCRPTRCRTCPSAFF